MLPVSPALLEDEGAQAFVREQLADLARAHGGSEPFRFWVQWSWVTDPDTGEQIDVPYMMCEGPVDV
jgi:hypothetical protein